MDNTAFVLFYLYLPGRRQTPMQALLVYLCSVSSSFPETLNLANPCAG